MYYWLPKCIIIFIYFLKLAIFCQYFDQYLGPIYQLFLQVFYATKPNISFVTSKLLCTIGPQIVQSFYPPSSKLAITCQYFDQYLSPINHTFLQVFCATKHIISFVTSKLLYNIGLQSVQSFFPLSSELAIICQYFNQYLRPINYAFLYIFCATKPNNSFVASKFLCTIGLQSLQSFFPISSNWL